MANVVPANDAQAFLDSLEKSQILPAEKLGKVRERFESATDFKAVAREMIKEGLITKWQAQQLLGKFTALIVGNYKLMDQLGVGEMGRVFLAEHVQMQRKVALKVLARKHTSQPNVLRRLLAEARRVAAIEHPNISHIQDVNQDGDRYFIVLEYIDGEDLRHVVSRGGKLAPLQAWNYVRQAAEGLAHAHSKGIVHGGLKPSNLLVDKSGNLKILDFGLAQLANTVDAPSGDSVEEAALLAKLYRAPESETGRVSQAADVYSLGALLYFLVSSKDPTDGPASSAKLADLAPGTPPELIELCAKFMSAEPADRPENDQALLAAIDAAKPSHRPPAPTKSAPALPKATALPQAKALPTAAAKEPPPRVKKPVMAKALPIPDAPPPEQQAEAEIPTGVPAEATPEAPADDSPFGGFAIQTKKAKAPPPKATSGAMPAVGAPAPMPAAAAEPVAKGAKSKAAGKNNLPLFIAGGVGGGVLVLGLIIGLIVFLTSGGKDKDQLAKAEAEKAAAAAGENTTGAAGESNPGEANPAVAEANPAIAEANPTVEANPVVPMPAAEANPMPAVVPMPATTEPKPEPEPAPMPEPKPADPPMVASVTPEQKPEPKPEPKPAPKPAPKPVGNPFVGFAKYVALPKVPSGISEAPAEMLAPIVLGPCKVPDENTIISTLLKGGETAYNKGKMKITLESANGGTSLRDWEFKVSGGLSETPVTVAIMSAKNDQLTFQWTPEAVKQPAAPYLCNCLVEMKAGNGQTQFALREPVTVEPIILGIDKRPAPARINIDLPPESKQLMVEIIAVEGDVPKVKYDNKDLVAEKDTTFFWVGNVETEMPLGIKVDTSVTNSGRTVQIITMPQMKLEGMPRPINYSKKDIGQLKAAIDQELQIGNAMIQQASLVKDAKQKQELNQAGTLRLEPAQKANAQFEQMLALAQGLQTNGKLHFRVYATADDGKVELLNTGVTGQAAPEAAPAGNAKK